MSITGPPSFFANHGSGFGWYDCTPGKAKTAFPKITLPIIFFSNNSLDFCIPAPKNVSGALPIYRLFFFAKFINSFPSLKFIANGFSE